MLSRFTLIVLSLATTVGLTLSAHAATDDLASQTSAKDFAQTVVALRETINGSKAKIFQEIDHRSNALASKIDLPPSHVFIFGNPEVGSRLMQCVPLTAVDLPLRMLIREGEEGKTTLYWTPASVLVARYSDNVGEACQELAAKVDATLAALAQKAAAAEE